MGVFFLDGLFWVFLGGFFWVGFLFAHPVRDGMALTTCAIQGAPAAAPPPPPPAPSVNNPEPAEQEQEPDPSVVRRCVLYYFCGYPA